MTNDNFLDSKEALFHYTKTSIALESILFQQKLRFNSLAETHDPVEYNAIYFGGSGFITKDVFVDPSEMFDRVKSADGVLNAVIKKQCKIACFSSNTSDANIRGYNRSRMWSQYADGHRGVCLVFDKNILLENINQSLKTLTNPIIVDDYVDYKNEFGINPEAYNLNTDTAPNPNIKEYLDNFAKDVFFTKNKDYRDETEYRIMIYAPEMDMFFAEISSALKAIILGDRFPEGYRSIIESYCKRNNIIAKKMDWYNGIPNLLPLEWKKV